MYISRIELENIKSHKNAVFEFAPGTTAITGENGAGKTTIIEAIAWTLFDLLEYKKEDFVRRGEKRGIVRIAFESGLDEREYVVTRDTGTTYHVTDPRLGTRIADKKEEVFRFLWQHLGLEPGTDLRSLFRQAIGVPQGTFTAIFLEGTAERKTAFDRLLKVEEYRQAAEKLRDTSRFLEAGIYDLRESVARFEGELARAASVENEHRSLHARTETLAADAAKLDAEIEHQRHIVARLDELEKVQKAIDTVLSDKKRLQESLDAVHKARAEIAALRPKIDEQEKLEAEAAALRQQLADLRAVEKQALDLDGMIERLRTSFRTNSEELRKVSEQAELARDLGELEKREAELVREIASLNASLERDERFQREIRDGFCPVLSEKCLNLKPGQTLEAFVATQFSELRSQIVLLEGEHSTVTTNLKTARDAEKAAAAATALARRSEELKNDGLQLAARRKELGERISGLAGVERRVSDLEVALRALADPRTRVKYLENETAREAELANKQRQLEASAERLESDRSILVEELEKENFVAAGGYDAVLHSAQRKSLHESEKRLAEIRATLDAARTREEQLAAELSRFAEIRTTLQAGLRERERLEKVAEATTFIRETLKEAAPRVARNYVYHVSIEAAQMFREIIGDAEKTLRWNEDYSITLEQGSFERPFTSLSGGEQMAAALAVRLALLKQLTDVRIAFFDEPTANMDAERRENFAMQLGRISHFDQLFVISHDDTFDQYVDNVIALGARE